MRKEAIKKLILPYVIVGLLLSGYMLAVEQEHCGGITTSSNEIFFTVLTWPVPTVSFVILKIKGVSIPPLADLPCKK